MGQSLDFTMRAGDAVDAASAADRLARAARVRAEPRIDDYWGEMRQWLVDHGMQWRTASSVVSFLRRAAGGADPVADLATVQRNIAVALEKSPTSRIAAPRRWRVRKWQEYMDAVGVPGRVP